MNDDVTIVGGVTRYQHGATEAEQEQNPTAQTARDYSTEVRVNAADFQGPRGFGLLATARTAYGSVASELTPDSVVTHGGMEMKLAQAEQLGLVKRDANGRYSEILPAERAERQRAQEYRTQARQPQPTEAGDVNGMQPEYFAPAVEAGLAELIAGVEPQMVNRVLVDAALLIAEAGSLESLNLEAVMSKTGLPADKAAAFMTNALGALSEQADRALMQQQVDPQQFVEWARRERPEQFKQAMLEQIGARSLSGYRMLAKTFLRETTPSAEGLNQAGYETMFDPTSKRLLVKYNGVWTDARAAAIQGLI